MELADKLLSEFGSAKVAQLSIDIEIYIVDDTPLTDPRWAEVMEGEGGAVADRGGQTYVGTAGQYTPLGNPKWLGIPPCPHLLAWSKPGSVVSPPPCQCLAFLRP